MPAIINQKVLVALSGGVDSSVSVHLLQKQGYEVSAVVLDLSPAHAPTVQAAKETAQLLDIPLTVLQAHDVFLKNVVEPFAMEYRKGHTPNPCIFCNPSTKFHLICEEAKKRGISFIATGHYASIEHREDGRHLLKKASFIPRDQSYMLYRLTQEQLGMLLLPLQELSKDKVRQIATDLSLPSAKKPDSQEICFIPDNDYAGYIERKFGSMPKGDFISPEGKPCGKHKGMLHYTIGQRKGLGLAFGTPVFVKHMDPIENKVYLAYKGEEYAKGVELSDSVFMPVEGLCDRMSLSVKIRSMAQPAPATVTKEGGQVRVVFAEPQRAPAPGQSCVFYDGDYVVGGGYIETVF